MKTILTTLLFLALSISHLYANEDLVLSNGLAMHGAPKYGADATHLDYTNPDAPKGGSLRQAATGSFDTINPYSIKGNSAKGLNLIYDRLMRRVWDEPFTMYPLIAEKVSIPEARSAITFYLNTKARFHDQTPITADDVLFSFETLKEHGRPNMRRIYKLVKDAQKIDNHTVTFIFGEGYDRETVMIMALMPVLSKTYWENRTFDSATLETPNTNGPYRIKTAEPGRRIVYERIPDYWAKDLLANKGHYNFDEITYDYFRDDTVALEAFNKGDLNFRREFSASKWQQAYDDNGITKAELPHQRPERVRALIFNMRRAPFDDLNVRKALSLAFDENWIGKNIYYGQQKRIESYFPNSGLAALQAKKGEALSYRLRLRAAADLLKDSGWLVENGELVKNGQTFTFELLLSAPEEEKIALNFKKSLERLGITMNIRVLDTAAFQTRRGDYDYDMILHHWQNSLSPGTEQMLYWSCEAANQPNRFNYAGLCDPEVDKLAAAIADAKTYDELTAHARALDKILTNAHMAIPLFYKGTDYIAFRPPVNHPENIPLYGAVPETWWMDGDSSVNQH